MILVLQLRAGLYTLTLFPIPFALPSGLCSRSQNHLTHPQLVPLPYDEFLLGLSDLTGELMRFTITSLARGKGMDQVDRVCQFVRGCKAGTLLFHKLKDV